MQKIWKRPVLRQLRQLSLDPGEFQKVILSFGPRLYIFFVWRRTQALNAFTEPVENLADGQKPENKSLWKPLFCIFEGKMKIPRSKTVSENAFVDDIQLRRLNFKDMGEYIYVFYLDFTCILPVFSRQNRMSPMHIECLIHDHMFFIFII